MKICLQHYRQTKITKVFMDHVQRSERKYRNRRQNTANRHTKDLTVAFSVSFETFSNFVGH